MARAVPDGRDRILVKLSHFVAHRQVIDWITRNNKPHVAVQINNGQPTSP
jgi:hypothetical protein